MSDRWRRLARRLLWPARSLRARMRSIAARRAVRPVLACLDSWVIETARGAPSGTTIARLRARRGDELAFLKVADEPHGIGQLEREWWTLRELHAHPTLGMVRPLIPAPIAWDGLGGRHYLLLQALPGSAAACKRIRSDSAERLLREASAVAQSLHSLTAVAGRVGVDEVTEWIDRPLALTEALIRGNSNRLADVRSSLAGAITDTVQRLGWVHGDYWCENLLIDPDSGRISGVVDWDSAEGAGLALHDQLHLVLYSRKNRSRGSIGAEVRRALTPGSRWSDAERTAVQAAIDGLEVRPPADPLHVAVVLYWLRLVSMNMTRQPALTGSSRWVRENIENVVASL